MTVAGVTITHPEREVFPDVPLSKGALAEYYEAVAPLMLPHVRNRPISSVRCPEGSTGECFFQKHWPANGGAKITTKPVTEGEGEPKPYAFVSDARGLVALIQHGVIETHIWGARYDNLDKPDRLVLDLDPGPGVPWRVIKTSAQQVRRLFAELGLESWVKLTGGKGIHVVVPIERRVQWDVVNGFAKACAERLVRDTPALYVVKASKAIRDNRIFIDWMRNSRGATFAAPWCARARPGAPVSVPLRWDELGAVRKPDAYSVPKVMKMVTAGQVDPWDDLLQCKQWLTADMAVQLLAEGAAQ